MSTGPDPSPAPLSGDEESFIRAFARASLTVPRAFETDLLREQRMTLSEYFTLMHLSEAPARRLRMSDLAAARALSLSGMTRIVDRLEAAGLVQRERSADDRRGLHAVLTEAGLDRLREAWPTHLASVRRHLFDHLGGIDLAGTAAALGRVATESASASAGVGCGEDLPESC